MSPQISISIAALDGFSLAAHHFAPSSPNGDAVIINAAMAVRQHFYHHFAAFLAAHGYDVISYDYRGIGDSRPRSLRGFQAGMRDWAELDMAGVIAWVVENLRPRRLFLVGHSIGGQVVGLMPDVSPVSAMVTVSAQNGYWGLHDGISKYQTWLIVHLVFPAVTHLVGYLPWSWFAPGVDMPKGAALEWSRWARQRKYILSDASLPNRANYERFSAPVLAYSFDDDPWSSHRSVEDMMSYYPNASVQLRRRGPDDVGGQPIGHMGFFRVSSQPLWEEVEAWFGTLP